MYAIVKPLVILQAWVSLYTVLKSVNLKSRQYRYLRKLPTIALTNNSLHDIHLFSSSQYEGQWWGAKCQ